MCKAASFSFGLVRKGSIFSSWRDINRAIFPKQNQRTSTYVGHAASVIFNPSGVLRVLEIEISEEHTF
jgi:hypothetical protein